MRMRYISRLVILCCFLPIQAFAFGIGLTPSTVELEVIPGSHHRQILRVKNFNTDRPIKLTASIADWTLDETGKVQLLSPESGKRSSSAWINFSPRTLLLEPNTTRNIIVDINTPLSVNQTGDHRTAIILSTMLPPKKDREGKQGVWNRYQIATLFYTNVMPGKAKPAITDAQILGGIQTENGRGLQFHIENTGDRHVRMDGQIVLKSAAHDTVANLPFQGVLLNNYGRDFEVALNELDLPAGDYEIAFDLRGDGKAIPVRLDQTPRIRIH